MINYLCWNGVAAAQDLLPRFTGARGPEESDDNRPVERRSPESLLGVADEAFRVASEHLSGEEIRSCMQKWIKDDMAGFLLRAAENQGTSTAELAQALGRFHDSHIDDRQLSRTIQVELRVSLARRFLTDDLAFVDVAKDYIDTADYFELARHVIAPPKSHGRVGGKSAGLLLATQIVRKSTEFADALGTIRIPKTWYLTSDGILDFIEYNQLEDLYNRKYLEIDQVRREYPHVVQVFKNSHFSPEIVKGLSLALDDFEDRPLIVRSSSLLEDRVGSAFSGKYKSLFLANRGTKAERLSALLDAVAEVYASVFGPDPLEYRAERGLLDVHEEMGILLQEVVGCRVGRYFLPTFAGVAFSNNEFRWSARIKRADGLVRLVPGLGTRAVDRLADDYPVLVAPGQPGLRVNVTEEEIVRYSPRKVDVIDMESGSFETIEIERLLAACGPEIPGLEQIVSVADESGVHRPYLIDWRARDARLVVTFAGLLESTPFLARMRALLRLLREKTRGPVDIEFASDGKDLFLLQCRPQSFSEDATSAVIPPDLPAEKVIFEARRYVSNGRVPDLTHVVYVDPGRVRRALRSGGAQEGGPGRRPPQQGPAEAAVRAHGPGAVGQPRRPAPRRARDVLGHQQHGRARRDRAKARELRAGSLVRNPFLPGPRRGLDPLRSALSRRSRDPLPRGLPEGLAERSRGPRARVRGPRPRRPGDRRAPGDRRLRPEAPAERRPGSRRRGARGERPGVRVHGRRAALGRRGAPRGSLALARSRWPNGSRPRPSPLDSACGGSGSSAARRTARHARRATSTSSSTSTATASTAARSRRGSRAGARALPRSTT